MRTLVSTALLIALMAGVANAAVVEVAVNGVRNANGRVHVDLCTQATFLKGDCPYHGDADARPGATVVTIAGVPPGVYAAQAFHDETGGGVVHQGLFGIPKEAIGFSNNAPLHVRGPDFDDAVFSVDRGVERISLRVRRLLRTDG
ncbi:MAG TPA: DUF2141 domain-containing protein [Caulobacteraceae bacterium]